MIFREADIVVHPFHGPLKVRGLRTRQGAGNEALYAELHSLDERLSVAVPVKNAEHIGLRNLLTRHEIEDIVSVLTGPSIVLESQWSRRIKALQERAQTGRPTEQAIVVRELIRRGADTGRSGEERRLLRTTMSGLALEMALALSINLEDMRAMMELFVRGALADLTVGLQELDQVGFPPARLVS